MDWAHEKRVYLDSVKKHISGNQGGRKGRILSQLCALYPEYSCSSTKIMCFGNMTTH